MKELFQLFLLGSIFGLGISGIIWLIGLFVSGAISTVFKNNT